MRRFLLVLIALTALIAGAQHLLRTNRDAAVLSELAISPVTVPAAGSSGQPQLAALGGGAILSWIERSGKLATLKFAERTESGWSEPRTVASGEDWFVNWADVPSVVPLDDGTLAAHWLQRSGLPMYAYDVRLSWSRDGGRTWTQSVTPHHDKTETEHGFASLFQVPGAGLGLVWLDGRATGVQGEDGEFGAMSVRAAVFDTSGQQKTELLVDDRVCECCPTTAAVTDDGIIAAFRNRTTDEIRDIYVSRFTGGKWTEPTPVHNDGWHIDACPVNGPALAARGRNVAIAWFTATGDHGRSYVAFSSDSGRSFGAPIRVDDVTSLGRVDVDLLDDGSAVAGWIEFADGKSGFRVRRVTPRGQRSASQVVSALESGRASGYPRLVRRGDELLFAWTETGEQPRVRSAVARLP